MSVVFGDVNGDGKADLIVATGLTNSVSLLLGNGNGTFQANQTFATSYASSAVATGDFNGDGRLDLAVVNGGSVSNTGSILLNSMTGNFTGQIYTLTTAATTSLAFTGLPSAANAGAALPFTLTALDPSNHPVTSYTGTVHFSSTDSGASSVIPADYTFTPADGGVHVFTSGAVLVTSGVQTLTAFDTAFNALNGSASVLVQPAALAHFSVSAPTGVLPNTAFDFTVMALDRFGNTITGYTGTVGFASSDPQALLPGNTTLTNGVGIFSATLKTAGKQTVTATDTGNAAVMGGAAVNAVNPSGVGPVVQSITRMTPAGPVTNAGSVIYMVTFSQAVTGVNVGDFDVTLTGTATGALTNVTPLSGSVYAVTVSGLSGAGTLALDLVDNGSIFNLAGNPLTHQNAPAAFQVQQTFAVGYGPSAVALGDVNGDGNPDLVVAKGGSNTLSVLLGNGNGTFQAQQTFATGTKPYSLAVGDVNGDGKADLIATNYGDNTVSVLLSNGNGTFQAQRTFATGDKPRSVAVGDVTGDGKDDLIVGNYGTNTISLLLGNGNGAFQTQQTFTTGNDPSSLALGDLNGNGKADLVVANAGSNTVSVLLSNANGTFQTQQTFAVGNDPISVAVADVNGDGKTDIVVADKAYAVSVLLGNGNGTFQAQQTFPTGAFAHSMVVGDVNGDGKPDLVVPNEGRYVSGHTVSVLLGDGNGTFQTQQTIDTGYFPISVALGDVNGDGKPDLVVGNVVGNTIAVLLNSNKGNFTGQIYTLTTGATTNLAISGLPSAATAGSSLTFTLTALDPSTNPVPGYTGTVHFSTTDSGPRAVLPADYTFVPSDHGVHVFTSVQILVSSGVQTLTASDTAITALTASAARIGHSRGGHAICDQRPCRSLAKNGV